MRYVAGTVLGMIVLGLLVLWIVLACSGCAFTTAGAKEVALAVADRVIETGAKKIVESISEILPPPPAEGHGDLQELIAIGLSAVAVIGHRYVFHRNGKHDPVRRAS